MDALVPVAVEFMAIEIDAREVGRSDFDACQILLGVYLLIYLNVAFILGVFYQLNNVLIAD